jgi:hypothetical protein
MPRPPILAVLLTALALTLPALGDDVAEDYRAVNPNGPWRFGWTAALGGPFALMDGFPAPGHIDQWRGGGGGMVLFNRTARPQSLATATLPPGTLALHPGQQGQIAVVRWTAPRAGLVRVQAQFSRRDASYPTTSDVHVLREGTSVFDAMLDTQRERAAFVSLVSVRVGTTLDFAVGRGANADWAGDSTGLALRIEWQRPQR